MKKLGRFLILFVVGIVLKGCGEGFVPLPVYPNFYLQPPVAIPEISPVTEVTPPLEPAFGGHM